MKNFKLDARQVKCVMNFQSKNDVRYYLNGFLVGDGKMVSTDGHRMAIVESPNSDFEPIIIQIRGTLLSSAVECEFVFIGDDYGIVQTTNSKGQEQDKVLKFCIIDGRFPDWKRVVPTCDPVEMSNIGFNLSYLVDVDKAARDLGSKFEIGKFEFFGEGKAGVVSVSTPENKAKFVIMPTRS